MPRSANRNLPRSADLLTAKDELLAGRRIVIGASLDRVLAVRKASFLVRERRPLRSRCS